MTRLWQLLYPRFNDRELERRYVLENNAKAARQARWGFLYGAIFGYALLLVISYFTHHEFFSNIFWFVAGFVVPTHLFAAWFVAKLQNFFYLQWLFVFANVFSNSCLLVILYRAPYEFCLRYGYSLVLCVLVYSFAMLRMRTFFATIGSSLVIGQYLALIIFLRPLPQADIVYHFAVISFVNIAGLVSVSFFESYSRVEFLQSCRIKEQNRQIAEEKKKSEALLLNILPESIARRLLAGETTIADYFDNVSVLLADIEGFILHSRAALIRIQLFGY